MPCDAAPGLEDRDVTVLAAGGFLVGAGLMVTLLWLAGAIAPGGCVP